MTIAKVESVRKAAKEASRELDAVSKQALKDYVESVRPPKG